MKRLSALIMITFCFLAMPVIAKNAHRDAAQRILSLSGLSMQFKKFPENLEQSLEGSRGQYGEEKFQVLHQAMMKSLEGDVLEQAACEYLRQHASDTELEAIVSWYRLPISRKINSLTDRRLEPGYEDELARFAKTMEREETERTRLANRLIETTKYVELKMALVNVIFYSMIDGVNRTMPKERRLSRDDLDSRLRPVLMKYEEAIRKNALVEVLFVFERVENDDFRKYVELIETPEGRKAFTLVNGAMVHALGVFSDRMGRQIGEAVTEK